MIDDVFFPLFLVSIADYKEGIWHQPLPGGWIFFVGDLESVPTEPVLYCFTKHSTETMVNDLAQARLAAESSGNRTAAILEAAPREPLSHLTFEALSYEDLNCKHLHSIAKSRKMTAKKEQDHVRAKMLSHSKLDKEALIKLLRDDDFRE